MKKLICAVLLMLALAPLTLAQDTVTATNSTAAVASPTITSTLSSNPSQTISQSPNQTVNQTFAAADAGQGRWFATPVQPYEAPVLPYFGPWNTGANILDDLRTLPQEISLPTAKLMYRGGVKVRVNVLFDPPPNTRGTCKLLYSLPTMPLMKEGKQVTNAKGEPLYVLNEAMFRRAAYIFLQGDKNADTADVIAKAVIEAMKLGANGIILVKKVTLTSVIVIGLGIRRGSR